MPEPIIMTSLVVGMVAVVLWFRRWGSRCQNEEVEFVDGRVD
jgi:hypothetical protein